MFLNQLLFILLIPMMLRSPSTGILTSSGKKQEQVCSNLKRNCYWNICIDMKHLLLLVFILTSLPVFSQEFQGGIFLGFIASQVDGDSYAGYDKLGVTGGVFVSNKILPWLNGRLEIRYASRGARNPASEDNTGSYLLALHYIDVPVMGEIGIKKYGFIELGLVPGYMFHANGEDDAGPLPQEYLVDFRKFDLGTLIGINVSVTQKISATLRYSYST